LIDASNGHFSFDLSFQLNNRTLTAIYPSITDCELPINFGIFASLVRPPRFLLIFIIRLTNFEFVLDWKEGRENHGLSSITNLSN